MDMTQSENAYDPKTVELRTFHDAIPAFQDGTDTPRDYLERCLETIGKIYLGLQAANFEFR